MSGSVLVDRRVQLVGVDRLGRDLEAGRAAAARRCPRAPAGCHRRSRLGSAHSLPNPAAERRVVVVETRRARRYAQLRAPPHGDDFSPDDGASQRGPKARSCRMGRPGCVRGRHDWGGALFCPLGWDALRRGRDHRALRSSTSRAAIRAGEAASREVVEAHVERLHERQPRINAVAGDRFADGAGRGRRRGRARRGRRGEDAAAAARRAVHDQGVDRAPRACRTAPGWSRAASVAPRRRARRRAAARRRRHPARRDEHVRADDVDRVRQPRLRPHEQRVRPDRTAGGSSGGEGAAVGAGGSPFGLGSDIGGSIRLPAFFNGVFGHKPLARAGAEHRPVPERRRRGRAHAHVGPIARRAEDLMPVLRIIAGPDGGTTRCASASSATRDVDLARAARLARRGRLGRARLARAARRARACRRARSRRRRRACERVSLRAAPGAGALPRRAGRGRRTCRRLLEAAGVGRSGRAGREARCAAAVPHDCACSSARAPSAQRRTAGARTRRRWPPPRRCATRSGRARRRCPAPPAVPAGRAAARAHRRPRLGAHAGGRVQPARPARSRRFRSGSTRAGLPLGVQVAAAPPRPRRDRGGAGARAAHWRLGEPAMSGCCNPRGCDEFFNRRFARRMGRGATASAGSTSRRGGWSSSSSSRPRRARPCLRSAAASARSARVLQARRGAGGQPGAARRRTTRRRRARARGRGGRTGSSAGCTTSRSAPEAIEPVDIVVLHRVVCCYPDYERLLGAAAATAPSGRWSSATRPVTSSRARFVGSQNLLFRALTARIPHLRPSAAGDAGRAAWGGDGGSVCVAWLCLGGAGGSSGNVNCGWVGVGSGCRGPSPSARHPYPAAVETFSPAPPKRTRRSRHTAAPPWIPVS